MGGSKTRRNIRVSVQNPGELPSQVSIPKGTTLGEFIDQRNIGDYIVSLNGSSRADRDTELQSKDELRIGLKTKNN